MSFFVPLLSAVCLSGVKFKTQKCCQVNNGIPSLIGLFFIRWVSVEFSMNRITIYSIKTGLLVKRSRQSSHPSHYWREVTDFDTKPLVPTPPYYPLFNFLNNLPYHISDFSPTQCSDPPIFHPNTPTTMQPPPLLIIIKDIHVLDI